MAVTKEALERTLALAAATVRDPRHGLFGPHSMTWRVNREQVLFLAGGRAALLQEAHPFVAHGVEQHSRTRADPWGRFERTFRNVHAILFGDLDSALCAARSVHKIHLRIRGHLAEPSGAFAEGSRYDANDEAALLWVHATLWDSALLVYETLIEPLSAEQRERYYQETKLFAAMFGLDERTVPAHYADFAAYNRSMWASEQLFVGTPARTMARFLLSAPHPTLEPVMAWYRVMTAALLPRRIRTGYGFHYGTKERALFQASLPALKAMLRVAPRQARYVPAYVEARARIGRPVKLSLAERMVGPHLVPKRLRRAA